MIAGLARVAIIGALCLAIGLHWFLLQSIAWTGMLVKYSARSSLTEAVARTFDGEHPCSLCHLVQQGKASEKQPGFQPATPKFSLFLVAAAARFRPAATGFEYAAWRAGFPTRADSPPAPPPRLALV